ncbi:hypothetical protein ALC56_11388 [Trachymyrmex septentrionalis]|uniref:Uncharacterized protein n=1 Tax=Trachymyrmex septentrionalis TaxID=34720 RepID=A0A195F1M6_9HYME|nr:hypothetical protein ALC56_11388 [Trachymyrmex septentrionalis]
MRTCETGMKTKREDTGEDAWRATSVIRLCDYSCRIFEHARVRSRDIQYLERAKLFSREKRFNGKKRSDVQQEQSEKWYKRRRDSIDVAALVVGVAPPQESGARIARSSQVRSVEGEVKNGKGSRTEREEDDYSGSSVSEALMGVWRVTSPLQAGREGDFTIEESVERTEKHLAVHYAVHSIV